MDAIGAPSTASSWLIRRKIKTGRGSDTRQRQDGERSTEGDRREEDRSKWARRCEEQQGDGGADLIVTLVH